MGENMSDHTIAFSLGLEREDEIKSVLKVVYEALQEKGYNPGYILSEDPTYITTHNNARSYIRKIDRDELLQIIVKNYIQRL